MGFKHGHAGTVRSPTYVSYNRMIARCENERHPFFSQYGGRGIAVCPRWRFSFVDFLDDMGERPSGCELDRIDNDLGYEPSNCRWISHQENMRNRRDTVRLTVRGETLTAYEWAKRVGCNAKTILFRVWRGWPHERAVLTPVRRRIDNRGIDHG